MSPLKNLTVDVENGTVTWTHEGKTESLPINHPRSFEMASHAWLRCGWDVKHVYTFAWMGRPIIQLPEDIVRMQELIYTLKPDVVLECGVAHGGSLVLYASIMKAMGKGRVIGVDVEIRPHNRMRCSPSSPSSRAVPSPQKPSPTFTPSLSREKVCCSSSTRIITKSMY